MRRIVLFGMNGGYSATALHALSRSHLRPVLVVVGLERTATSAPIVEERQAKARWLPRFVGKKKDDSEVVLDETNGDLARLARTLEIDVLRTSDANVLRARARIAEAEPDAFVIAGFPHLLSVDLLGLAKRGGLNLHPGRLPEERGPSPWFWALREGRTKLDYTIHVLDSGEDSGDVVARGEVAIDPGVEASMALLLLSRAAAPALVRVTRGLLDGDLVRTPQPQAGVGRRPRPTFRDGLVDPSKSAAEVFTFVSACAKTHSLFVESAGDRFFIESALGFDPAAKLAFEYALTGDHLILRCNPGVVELVLKEEGALFSAEYEG